MARYFTVILASDSRRLFTGATSDLTEYVRVHRDTIDPALPARDRTRKLVYHETAPTLAKAQARERQLKHWPRPAKVRLIQLHNPGWEDLAEVATDGARD